MKRTGIAKMFGKNWEKKGLKLGEKGKCGWENRMCFIEVKVKWFKYWQKLDEHNRKRVCDFSHRVQTLENLFCFAFSFTRAPHSATLAPFCRSNFSRIHHSIRRRLASLSATVKPFRSNTIRHRCRSHRTPVSMSILIRWNFDGMTQKRLIGMRTNTSLYFNYESRCI